MARTCSRRPSAAVTAIGTSIVSSPASARAAGISAASSSLSPSGERASKSPTIAASERPASGRPASASARSFASAIRPSVPYRNAGWRMAARRGEGSGMAQSGPGRSEATLSVIGNELCDRGRPPVIPPAPTMPTRREDSMTRPPPTNLRRRPGAPTNARRRDGSVPWSASGPPPAGSRPSSSSSRPSPPPPGSPSSWSSTGPDQDRDPARS